MEKIKIPTLLNREIADATDMSYGHIRHVQSGKRWLHKKNIPNLIKFLQKKVSQISDYIKRLESNLV